MGKRTAIFGALLVAVVMVHHVAAVKLAALPLSGSNDCDYNVNMDLNGKTVQKNFESFLFYFIFN